MRNNRYNKDYVTLKEFSTMIGVKVQTVHRWITKKTIEEPVYIVKANKNTFRYFSREQAKRILETLTGEH